MRYMRALDYFYLNDTSKIIIVENLSTTTTQDGPMNVEQIISIIYAGEWLISHPALNPTKTYLVVDAFMVNDRAYAERGEPIGLAVTEYV